MLIEKHSQATDLGLMRENNEDAILSHPEIGLWLVADGMGGHAAGEVASQITSDTINQQVIAGASLQQAILAAHKAIHQAVEDGVGKYGMGSTVVGLKSEGRAYQVAWVGDSRAYLYSNGHTLQALSIDHSYVQMLFQSGLITAEELSNHPEKNIITQCLGSNDTDDIVVDVVDGVWKASDIILLCSDGLTDIVSDQVIGGILADHSDLTLAVNALIGEALKNGGKDNISVILVQAPLQLKNQYLGLAYVLSQIKERFVKGIKTFFPPN